MSIPMEKSLETRQAAFDAARRVVSKERADEILKWKNWQYLGVLGGAARPAYPPVTDEEYESIKQLWLTLDGSASWMSALNLLRNNERPTKGSSP
ncbi:MAG: hypothetical protein AAF497_10505 [Planctomycetota bacterium]